MIFILNVFYPLSELFKTKVNTSNDTPILCGNGTLPNIDYIESQRCCNSSCEAFQNEMSDQITELCDWDHTCNLLSLNNSFTRSGGENTCLNQGTSLQTAIYYDCKRGNESVRV